MKFEDKIVNIQVGCVSLVGIIQDKFPLSYGNYFELCSENIKEEENYNPNSGFNAKTYLKSKEAYWYVNNFNFENFEEAIKRFLLDKKVKIRIFSDYNDNMKSISIIDERIPQEWFIFWGFGRGYCNGQLRIDDIIYVKNNLTKRFTNTD